MKETDKQTPLKVKENIMWCVAAAVVTACVYFTFVFALLAEYVIYG